MYIANVIITKNDNHSKAKHIYYYLKVTDV